MQILTVLAGVKKPALELWFLNFKFWIASDAQTLRGRFRRSNEGSLETLERRAFLECKISGEEVKVFAEWPEGKTSG